MDPAESVCAGWWQGKEVCRDAPPMLSAYPAVNKVWSKKKLQKFRRFEFIKAIQQISQNILIHCHVCFEFQTDVLPKSTHFKP